MALPIRHGGTPGLIAGVLCIHLLLLWMGAASCSAQIDGPEPDSSIRNIHSSPAVAVDTRTDSIQVDTALYNRLLLHIVHKQPSVKWPVKTAYPLPGALLPFKRIVAYYGNFYSTGMGVLGALPPQEMLHQLQQEVHRWELSDTLLPVQPALHYIAVTAQRNPGPGAKYRLRMPDREIDKALALAKSINAIVFLDIQVGHSTLQEEIPALEKYLRLPDVHLGIDPEYSMKNGQVPCNAIGTFDAADINYAITYLAELVQQYKLPPKVLVVHRFTQGMVTNYHAIKLFPEVQIVMNMDGFGGVAKKRDSYKGWIANQPVQFTGFKLFYKNDVVTGGHLMTPAEVLQLYPRPVYIQYQ
ncbi:MAG TPA: hypothetical protein VFS25_22335 [Chitinophaga sp.]|uniref:hypothetical protein n=1 Tax=Chitinophaga sp. TaxID=1869181 RepID=UPI002DBBE410|nr:hypothetical protein [Chitinophaga sp.]HEU4555601.1 hypothetical protein [Chitinophaga sp.]